VRGVEATSKTEPKPEQDGYHMSRSSFGWMSLVLALLVAGCGSKVPYNPFKISPEQVRSRVKVVALAPMAFPRELEDPVPATKKFLGMMEVEMRGAGLTVIGAGEVQVIWDSLAGQMDGFYDPKTGARDEEKLKSVRMHLYRELKGKFNIDALLFSHLAAVGAKLDHDQAKWDGTSEGAGRKTFWKALLGVSHSGTIPALSLHVILSDTDDTDLYVNMGGIQVLAKIGPGGNFDPVPRAQLFSDEERNTKAVHLALDPLLGRTTKQ
jgi:hypothetical protein